MTQEEKFKNDNVLDQLKILQFLRQSKEKSQSIKDKKEYDNFLQKLVLKYSYIVHIHSKRYRRFPNYQDLVQEGYIGLVLAFNNFDVTRSKNFYRIANWYVKTRIKRVANKHEVLNIPMKLAKNMPPNRLADLPVILDDSPTAIDYMEEEQDSTQIKEVLCSMSPQWRKVVCGFYGINIIGNSILVNSENKKSIAIISDEMSISRAQIQRIISQANKKFSKVIY